MYLTSDSLFTSHRGQKGSSGLSPRIWDLKGDTMLSPDGGTDPKIHLEDFLCFGGAKPAITGDTESVGDGYSFFTSTTTTASSVTQIADELGVVELASEVTAHSVAAMQAGGATGASFLIPKDRAGLWRGFEARVRIPVGFTSATQGAFVGLMPPGNSKVTVMANTTMALPDVGLIGFHFPIGSQNVLRPVVRKSGSAVDESAPTIAYTPGEWVKVGLAYFHRNQAKGRLLVLVNNQVVGSYSDTQVNDALPSDVLLSPIAAVKSLSTPGGRLQVDWLGWGRA